MLQYYNCTFRKTIRSPVGPSLRHRHHLHRPIYFQLYDDQTGTTMQSQRQLERVQDQVSLHVLDYVAVHLFLHFLGRYDADPDHYDLEDLYLWHPGYLLHLGHDRDSCPGGYGSGCEMDCGLHCDCSCGIGCENGIECGYGFDYANTIVAFAVANSRLCCDHGGGDYHILLHQIFK